MKKIDDNIYVIDKTITTVKDLLEQLETLPGDFNIQVLYDGNISITVDTQEKMVWL